LSNSIRYRPQVPHSFSLNHQWQGDRLDQEFRDFESREVQLSSFHLLNFHYEYVSQKSWSLVAGVDNLFDENYEVVRDYSVLGRTFFMRLKWTML
jgi:outer membrane cobalamin receptor